MLVEESRIQPGRRVPGIETFGQGQFFGGQCIVPGVAEGLAQVTAQDRAVRLQRGGHVKILAPGLGVPLANAAQAAPQPGVVEGRIDGDGLVKGVQRLADTVLRGQKKSSQRNGLGVSRRHLERLLERGQRLRCAAETEFQFRNPRPGEAEVRRFCRGGFGGVQGGIELGTRLEVIGFREPLAGQGWRCGAFPRLELHRGD